MATKKTEQVATAGSGARRKVTAKHVTLPQIKIVPEVLYCFTFMTAPKVDEAEQAKYLEEKRKAIDAGKEYAGMAPPHVAQVRDEETGELGMIVCPTVLYSELEKAYPDGYVGKSFDITMHKLQGKKYSTFSIGEVTFENAE